MVKLWTSAKADKLFSKYIRERDKTCYFGCGNKATQASHFWGRGNSSTRYDPYNVDGACGGCHMRNEENKQGLYRDLKIKQFGPEGYADLEKKARSVMKRSEAILEVMKLLQIII